MNKESQQELDASEENEIKWYLKDDQNKGVSTFIPTVLAKVDKTGPEATRSYVRLSLEFKEGKSTSALVPLKEIESTNWSDYDQRCILNQAYPKAGIYIRNIIQNSLVKVETETIHVLNELGIHHIDNAIVFAAGDQIICQSCCNDSRQKVELGNLEFRLDIDLNLNKEEAFDGIMDLINLSPEIGSILVAHVISGITRAAFKEAGFTPCTVLVVVGESGMMKSSYIPQLTQLYNRGDQVKAETRFNSTTCYIEDMLYEYRECTVVIDDLHTAESARIKKRNETTAEEIIRRISDDTGRGRKEGNTRVQREFNGNVVFIEEYVTGKESTIPRVLSIQIKKRPDGKILDNYQRHHPLLVSTFYYFFIQWYVDSFVDIRNEIDRKLTKFRETTADSTIHGRLRDTQFYLQISFMLFLEFCRESGFIASDYAVEQYCSFASYLNKLIMAQQARFRPPKDFNGDYLKLIGKLYKESRFCLADDARSFRQNRHDGLLYQDCLCLRRESLEKKTQEILPNIHIDEIIKFLVNQQALKLGKDKRTIKISAIDKSEGALRFYAIKLNMLD